MRTLTWIITAATAAGCVVSPQREAASWQVRACGVDHSLRGLAPLSAEVCYVGGAHGTLRKSTDGGATWLDVAPRGAEACDFRDVEVLPSGAVVAMVAGAPARLYRSSDGGASWSMVHEDPRPAAFFDAVAFDGPRGVVFGDALGGRFVLLESDDAGRTWREAPVAALPAPMGREAGFAASGTCVVPAARGFSLVTGGDACRHVAFGRDRRPRAVALPLRRGSASCGAFSIAWRGQRAVCVGGDYRAPTTREGTAAFSIDGGRTWRAADAGGYRSGVVWVTDRDVLAVGSHGASWSDDGGQPFVAFGSEPFHSVARGRDGSIWACGSAGRVARLVPAVRP